MTIVEACVKLSFYLIVLFEFPIEVYALISVLMNGYTLQTLLLISITYSITVTNLLFLIYVVKHYELVV